MGLHRGGVRPQKFVSQWNTDLFRPGSLDSALKLAQVELLRCRKVKEEFGDIFELVRERELKKANEESTSTLPVPSRQYSKIVTQNCCIVVFL